MLNRSTLLPLSAAAFVATLGVTTFAADVIEQVLVKVNGEVITKTEFEQRQVSTLRQRPEFASGAPGNEDLRRAIEEITPDLILSIVDELLMVQRGKEIGLALGDQQFNSILDNIKKENKLESEEQFQAALKQEGMTMADLRRNMERQMLVSGVQQREVADKIAVSEEETQAYYASRKQDFTTTSEITLREILIEVPTSNAGVNVAQDEAAREKAELVRSRLVAGEPFPRLAAEFSDAPSKANGGLIGPFKRTDLAPALQKVVEPLQEDGIAPVIRVARGYQILKLETRTPETIQSFEDARAEIADRVAQQKHRAELLRYLDRLREQAIIQWRNEELKKAYEQGLEKRRAAAGQAG
jgi:peptidyl-prolyl cis-trans isomerase SurA